MFHWFRGPEPRIWIWQSEMGVWHKVVTPRRPTMSQPGGVQGPLRTETEAEELADRLNGELVPFYRDRKVPSMMSVT